MSKLEEIEEHHTEGDGLVVEEVDWLISRVKELEEWRDTLSDRTTMLNHENTKLKAKVKELEEGEWFAKSQNLRGSLIKLQKKAQTLWDDHHEEHCEPPEDGSSYGNCTSTCTHLIWLVQDIGTALGELPDGNKLESGEK